MLVMIVGAVSNCMGCNMEGGVGGGYGGGYRRGESNSSIQMQVGM